MIETFDIHIADHILFLLLGIVLPWQTIQSQRQLRDLRFDPHLRVRLYLANSIGLWVLALLVLGLWWWTDRPLSALGIKWTPQVLSWWSLGAVAIFFLIYLGDAFLDLFTEQGREEVRSKLGGELGILPRNIRSYLFFIPLAFSAGICEEIVFRGYFIGYFLSLFTHQTGGRILAVLIPALIFGLVHTYQGREAIYKIVGMALIFGLLYLFTGSIYLLIILHIAVDLVGGSIGLFFPEPEYVDTGPTEEFRMGPGDEEE